MVMDNWLSRLPESVRRYEPGDEIIFTTLKQSLSIPESYRDDALPLNAPSNTDCPYNLSTHAPTLDSRDDHHSVAVPLKAMDAPSYTDHPNLSAHVPTLHSQDDHHSDAVIKYLNQVLLEENIDEDDHNVFYDPIALRAAENSFYEALRQNPSSPYQEPLVVRSNAERLQNTFGRSCDYSTSGSTISDFDTDQWIVDPEEPKSSLASDPHGPSFHSSSRTNLDSYNTNSTIGKKHDHPNESGLEDERRSKYSAVYKEEEEEEEGEVESSEMFDKVVVCADNIMGAEFSSAVGRKRHSKKKSGSSEFVDLETLLANCARSIAAFDSETAKEQLKVIRKRSSPTGDANQRTAHAFANALEARLNGTGSQLYTALAPNNMTASDLLKSLVISWPIKRVSVLLH